MGAEKKKQLGVLGVVIAIVVVLIVGVLVVAVSSGWFGDSKVVLDTEYVGEFQDFMPLSISEYDDLIKEGKSFVVFVDQEGCTTADRLRGYVEDYAKEKGLKVYRIMFSEVRESSLHEFVKFYPSVVLVSRGKPVAWLRADADEDADMYNDYDSFRGWIGRYLE